MRIYVPYVCFASCRSKFSTKCSQPKINFLFLKIDTLDSSPFELSSVFKKYFVSCYLGCEQCAYDKRYYVKWARRIGGMGQNLRKTPKTIRGFIIYLTISLKNSFLFDIEDRIHQTLIAYIFLTSDAYITFSASIVPVLISALHRATKRQNRPRIEKKSF